MVNIAAFTRAGLDHVLFPRGKHRPDAFHTGELTVSPATIDLCGILVAPFARDFERLSGDDVAAVYREVTLPEGQFRDVARLETTVERRRRPDGRSPRSRSSCRARSPTPRAGRTPPGATVSLTQ